MSGMYEYGADALVLGLPVFPLLSRQVVDIILWKRAPRNRPALLLRLVSTHRLRLVRGRPHVRLHLPPCFRGSLPVCPHQPLDRRPCELVDQDQDSTGMGATVSSLTATSPLTARSSTP